MTEKLSANNKFWPSLLLVILPACVALVAFYFFVMPLVDRKAAEHSATQIAALKANAIDASLENVAGQLQGLSRLSALRQALTASDQQTLALLEQEWALLFGNLDRLAIIPLNDLGVADLGPYRALLRNNIEKDIVQRAANDEKVVVDAYQIDGAYVVSLAKAVVAGNRKVGALLLSLNSDWLAGQLEALNDRSVVGVSDVTSLSYQVNNLEPVVFIRDRAAHSAEPVAAATSNLESAENIRLQYQQVNATPVSAVALYIVAGLLLLCVSCALFAALRLRSAGHRVVDQDIARLKRYLAEALENEATRPQFHISAFNSVIEGFDSAYATLMEKIRAQSSQAKTSSPSAKKAPVAAMEIEEVSEVEAAQPDDSEPCNIDLPAEIFRAYDIRGIADTELTDENVKLIGRTFGTAAQNEGHSSIVVARDGRLSSDRIAAALNEGLISSGCSVIDIGTVATPLLYFAVEHLQTGAGVMITGSHNPPEVNGFKMLLNGQALVDEQITALRELALSGSLKSGSGDLSSEDIVDAYIDQIAEDVVFASPLKIVLDCGNGAASEIAPMLFASLGSEVIPLFAEIDGNFPNHLPDPGIAENLSGLIAEVTRQGADLGLAFDGDGDRVVAVTGSGTIVAADALLMLFAKDVLTRNPGTDVVFDIKCSRNLSQVISTHGGRPVMSPSGHSRIKRKMRETGALLGGEYSGHFFFKERWFGFDDGLYSGARLVEMLTLEGESLDDITSQLPTSLSSPEIDIPVDDEAKFAVIDTLLTSSAFGEGEITDLDGVRVDYPEGWGLVRASNTSAKLTARFEADSEQDLERIQQQFAIALSSVGLSLAV